MSLKELHLRSIHEEYGAKFVSFAGTNMPINYNMGVLKEHLHTRSKAGLFDISHMRIIIASGVLVNDMLSKALPIDVNDFYIGKSQYSFFLNKKAGIIDDLIVNKLAENKYILVVNAANAEKDFAHISQIASEFTDKVSLEMPSRVILALQGPKASDVLATTNLKKALDLNFMQCCEPQKDWFVSRTGYTGEDGFEIVIPVSDAKKFVQKLLANENVALIGLAARDSLRLEAGLCLHGTDINEEVSPIEAALLWAIPKSIREKGKFIGHDAFNELIANKPEKIRSGFSFKTQQPVRGGATIHDVSGKQVGYITSGGFGPSLNAPVAMGYIDKCLREEKDLFARQRNKDIAIEVFKLPFVKHNYKIEKRG